MDKNSMLYWWQLVCDLDVPKPETRIVEMSLCSDSLSPVYTYMKKIRKAVKEVGGYPVFMRTDLMSGKFDWERTCFCASERDLIANIPNLVEFSENCDMIGRPVKALVFRRYIEMDAAFRAFHGLPISRERRYFVRDGKAACHHPYWPEEAIKFYSKYPANYEKDGGWVHQLDCLNYEETDEVELLTRYAEKIGSVLPGYWSVDFCLSRDGEWYFIDCAKGENSWHPECLLTKLLKFLN